MQVTKLDSQGLKKNFKITVDAARISSQTEAELKRAGEQVKIPGFRPGFIPMKVLQQRYGKSVQGDVLKQVINQTSSEVLKTEKLRPATMPQIDIENFVEGGELTYKMSVESFPEVPEIAFDKIRIDRNVVEIAESDIDETVGTIASRSPDLKPAKEGSAAKMGQVLTIDFRGMIGGLPFDGGSASNYDLELGSKQFIEGFEEQLVGTKVGDDKVVTVTFPADYPAEKLKGAEATFAVTVHKILDKETPVVDEAFAKDRGFADLRAFREAVRNQMMKEYEQVIRRQMKKELFDKLEKDYDFELPPSMVEAEFNAIWSRLQQAKAEGDPSVSGRDEEELREEYNAISRRRVKLGIMLAEIGNRNNVEVSREELGRAVMQQASQYPGQEKKVMEFYRNNPERVDDMRGPILEEKAVDFILTKIAFNDKKLTPEALIALEADEDAGKAEKQKSKASGKKKAAT